MGAPLTEGKAENNDMMKKPSAVLDEMLNNPTPLQTYINLIQQYLSVFMIENAVWLAERCVAEYPQSTDAVYLLALCHHRSGTPKAARQVLESARAASSAATDYLSAVCSYDLKDYNRAEEALLKSCRSLYKQNRIESTASSMDEWILSTTVRCLLSKKTMMFFLYNFCCCGCMVFILTHL